MSTMTKPDWLFFPTVEASEDEILKFVKATLSKDSRVRRWNLLRAARNRRFWAGQPVEVPKSIIANSSGGYSFKPMDFGGFVQADFDNRIGPGVDNVIARLTREEWQPNVPAERHIPEWEAAARMAKNLLLHQIQERNWPDLAERFARNMTLDGTTVGRAIWDETATDVSVVASPDAAQCPQCDFKLASSKVPSQMVRMGIPGPMGAMPLKHAETIKDAEPAKSGEPQAQITHCPTCDVPTPLQPMDVSKEQAEGEQQDPYGRPFGLLVPKGEGLWDCVNLFGFYPQDGGVVEPADCKVWGYECVKELEWIAARYPDCANDLSKGILSDMMKLDPTMGDEAFGSKGGPSIYSHHAIYGEVILEPMQLPGLEKGRIFRVCGDKLLTPPDLTLMKEVETPKGINGEPGIKKHVAKVKYAAARFKPVDGCFYGRTPVDDAIPLNRKIYRIDWQMAELRERGMPWVAVPPGTEINHRDDVDGPFQYVEVDSAEGWSPKDSVVNANPVAGNAYLEERDRLVAQITSLLGPAPFESGLNEASVKSGDHLEILAAESNRKRDPQERGLSRMYEQLWTAHLEQTWVYRTDKAEYEVEKAGSQFEKESFIGTDLLGQTRVKMEKQGAQTKSVFQAKAVQNAIQMGLIDIMDPLQREKARELMAIPAVGETVSLHVTGADQAYSRFMREGRIPFLDVTIHDPLTYYETWRKHWQSDEAMERQSQCGWEAEVLPVIEGWQKQLEAAEMMDQTQRAVYEGQDPATWAQIQADGNMKAELAGMPPLPAPPAEGFLPNSLVERILMLWNNMLGETLPDPRLVTLPEEELEVNDERAELLQFYAAVQSARIEAERRAMPPPTPVPSGAMPPAGMGA